MQKPDRKVGAGALGGAVATLVAIAWAQVTGDVAPAGLEAALATVIGFVVGYLVPESKTLPPPPPDSGMNFSADDE